MAQQLVEVACFYKVLVEETRIIFFLHLGQQGRDRRLHVSDETPIERRSASQVLRININLDLFHVAVWQKLGKRKICPQQQQNIGTVNRIVRSAVSEQSGHTGGVRIIVLEPLLAAKGVADGSFQFFGESQDFVARVPEAYAPEDGNRLGIVDQACKLFQFRVGRTQDGLGGNCDQMFSFRRLRRCDVARKRNHRRTALADGGCDGGVYYCTRLLGIHDPADVERRSVEKLVRIQLLKGSRIDQAGFDIAGDRDDRCALLPRVH